MNHSTATARALLLALRRLGVRDVVVSPGSRSAPLTYALAQLDAAGLVRVRVRIDEREAAFLALGIAKGLRASGRERPVAVVTTSGTAVANLHPAVLEASYGHLPLIALTADRPARLRGAGANQTIDDQSAVLSDVRARFDVAATGASPQRARESAVEAVARSLGDGFATGRTPGPVQLNVQFDVPLVPDVADMAPWWPAVTEHDGPERPAANGDERPRPPADRESVPLAASFAATVLPALGRHAVVLSGDAFDHAARRLVELLRHRPVPVLAEPSSPLVAVPELVVDHTRVLDARPELVARITDLIVLGKPTLSRQDQRLLGRPGLAVHRIQPDLDQVPEDEWEQALASAPEPTGAAGWAAEWAAAGRACAAEAEDGPQDVTAAVARAVLAAPGTVFAGSSNAVRYLDRALRPELRARVHASRGLAGIDGLVSTALGFAQGSGGPVRLLIGDVSLLHGIGGLLRESGEELGRVQIIVLNDDGGAIFAGLEHGRPHLAPYFPRYFATSHGRAFADFARAYGVPYEAHSTAAGVRAAIEAGRPGIIEVRLAPVRSPGGPGGPPSGQEGVPGSE
ncbi:2-succinyl-5-enolpyruvyl-6-hydroxy-3-cyclohexene- 1-carboxylic-acid synthase [Brevibacterium daeguense]|uniref:2-succinyl-5-enolpyruvyl-6-hydroxy-3-cyclohexene-1-carboxylate synthase n=1 Tax=Brevibacterium daeguense TaxID=909936 RepID=A0ABP8ELD0_9MICO|nr:2-succinyl-5-enolpyruvyl-6-hydroxy-3-cyclohexene-1-carboxylic-acid synthase [Brevibacterium daeguense]